MRSGYECKNGDHDYLISLNDRPGFVENNEAGVVGAFVQGA